MAENFSNLEKKIDIQIQEALRVPQKDITKVTHTKATYDLKCQKSKTRKEFKRRKRQTTSSIQGNPHRIISRFFRTNFTIAEENAEENFHPRVLSPAKFSFGIQGEVEFSRQAKLKSSSPLN